MKPQFSPIMNLPYAKSAFFAIFLIVYISGYTQSLNVSAYTGIEKSNVSEVVIDHQNKKWVLTEWGLKHIRDTFSLDPISLVLKKDTEVFDNISIDRAGNKWLVTRNGGLLKIAPNGAETLHPIAAKFGNSAKLKIKGVVLENIYSIWLATSGNNHQVICYNPVAKQIEKQIEVPYMPTCLYWDSNKTIWLGTQKGLFIVKKRKVKLVKKSGQIMAIAATSDHIYVISLDLKGSSLTQYALLKKRMNGVAIPIPHELRKKAFTDLAIDQLNQQLIFTANGIVNYDLRTRKWHFFDRKESGLESDYPVCISIDQDDVLWIGTEGKGLYYGHLQPDTGFVDQDGVAHIACDFPVEAGGYETKSFKIDMGIPKGKLKLTYDMFRRPDQLTITSNGRVIYVTKDKQGLPAKVSGKHEVSIPFTHPNLVITVTGGEKKTKWEFEVDCPKMRK